MEVSYLKHEELNPEVRVDSQYQWTNWVGGCLGVLLGILAGVFTVLVVTQMIFSALFG